MKARDNFPLLLELIGAVEYGMPARTEVQSWFLRGTDDWLRATGKKPLHEYLGITCRLRRDYLVSRQQNYLEDALLAFLQTHHGSAWKLSGQFVKELKHIERHHLAAATDPGSSQLSRSIWFALQLGLPIPKSRTYWFGRLHAIGQDREEINAYDPSDISEQHSEDFPMTINTRKGPVTVRNNDELHAALVAGYKADEIQMEATAGTAPTLRAKKTVASQSVEDRCKADWQSDASLRAEFGDIETYTAYVSAVERGLIKTVGVSHG